MDADAPSASPAAVLETSVRKACEKALAMLAECDRDVAAFAASAEDPDWMDLLSVRSTLAQITGVLRIALCSHPDGFGSSVGSCPHCGDDSAAEATVAGIWIVGAEGEFWCCHCDGDLARVVGAAVDRCPRCGAIRPIGPLEASR